MAKVLGIGAVVLGVWFFSEVYTKGTAGAFDGALSKLGFVEDEEGGAARPRPGARAGSAVAKAHADSDLRRERLLAE